MVASNVLGVVRVDNVSCFNPLHCGAVVASNFSLSVEVAMLLVSIPFIAGQWSLLIFLAREWFYGLLVSIPFIAGQWSLLRLVWGYPFEINLFQSPSLRGSGRF